VVIYGHNEPPEAVSLSGHDVQVALAHGQRMLALKMNGDVRQFLIKEVQYDHLGQAPIHLDLTRVDLHEKVQVKVGIALRGEPKGVAEGGVLDLLMPNIEIECLVMQIPDTLHPLVTELGLNEPLFVRDLKLPPGVECLEDPDAIVAIVRPREEEPETVEAPVEGEATAEPERIGRARKEEEESAGE
jgi:large subunit ribosomal protein L25